MIALSKRTQAAEYWVWDVEVKDFRMLERDKSWSYIDLGSAESQSVCACFLSGRSLI